MTVFKAIGAKVKSFKYPLTFSIPSNAKTAVLGSKATDLINVIGHKNFDYTNRITYPDFGDKLWPSQAIQYITFNSGLNSKAPFLGARYESFRDPEEDFSLFEVLKSELDRHPQSIISLQEVINLLNLNELLDKWTVGLSNGQNRRAQLALALLRDPKLLVIDEPFLGLDLRNTEMLSSVINRLEIPVVMKFRDFERLPNYISQVLYASNTELYEGERAIEMRNQALNEYTNASSRSGLKEPDFKNRIVELRDLKIYMKNRKEPLLNNINLTVHAGERVRISGPNGSGKSTLLSCITADHPQSWNESVILHGEPRTVGKHTYFGINNSIGMTSPERHAIVPKHRQINKIIQGPNKKLICSKLNLDLNAETPFGDLPLHTQKLVLFASALAKNPKILILDEAFSGIPNTDLKKCFDLLDDFCGATLVISHIDAETPVYHKELQL